MSVFSTKVLVVFIVKKIKPGYSQNLKNHQGDTA